MLYTNPELVCDDVPNLVIIHTIIKKHLVDSRYNLPLSQKNYYADPYDKEELCDSCMIIHMTQVVHENGYLVLEPNTCAEFVYFDY